MAEQLSHSLNAVPIGVVPSGPSTIARNRFLSLFLVIALRVVVKSEQLLAVSTVSAKK